MYPDLSYFFHDLFGTAPDNGLSLVKTFGLFLVFGVIGAAMVLKSELKRKEKEGLLSPMKNKIIIGEGPNTRDIIVNAIIGFVLGYKILFALLNVEAMKENAAEVLLSTSGNALGGLLGAIILAGWYYWRKKKDQLPKPKSSVVEIYPHERVGDIAIVAAFSGIIGAKIFAVFESPETWSAFISNPVKTLLSGSGLAIYGGLIVAFAVVYWYVKKRNIKPIHMMDAVAPALFVGYAIGRLGCHFSGDGDWGIVNTLAQPDWWFFPDWLWAYDYPRNVLNQGELIADCVGKYCRHLSEPVYPTPFYEFLMSMILAGILWILRKRIKIAGMIFFIYMIMNGFERFWIEKIRVNDKIPAVFNATQAEIIAVLIFIGGIIGCVFLWSRSRKIQATA